MSQIIRQAPSPQSRSSCHDGKRGRDHRKMGAEIMCASLEIKGQCLQVQVQRILDRDLLRVKVFVYSTSQLHFRIHYKTHIVSGVLGQKTASIPGPTAVDVSSVMEKTEQESKVRGMARTKKGLVEEVVAIGAECVINKAGRGGAGGGTCVVM